MFSDVGFVLCADQGEEGDCEMKCTKKRTVYFADMMQINTRRRHK